MVILNSELIKFRIMSKYNSSKAVVYEAPMRVGSFSRLLLIKIAKLA